MLNKFFIFNQYKFTVCTGSSFTKCLNYIASRNSCNLFSIFHSTRLQKSMSLKLKAHFLLLIKYYQYHHHSKYLLPQNLNFLLAILLNFIFFSELLTSLKQTKNIPSLICLYFLKCLSIRSLCNRDSTI